jgi:hypothetical protein
MGWPPRLDPFPREAGQEGACCPHRKNLRVKLSLGYSTPSLREIQLTDSESRDRSPPGSDTVVVPRKKGTTDVRWRGKHCVAAEIRRPVPAWSPLRFASRAPRLPSTQ